VNVHRSDGSATTFGFTDYLSTVSPDWQQRVGKGTAVELPVDVGASGNPGVAGEVQQTPYAIGYVELIYALQNNLGFGVVRNAAGEFINPSLASVTAAASSSMTTIPADLRFSIVNAPGADADAISTATLVADVPRGRRSVQGACADADVVVGDAREPALQQRSRVCDRAARADVAQRGVHQADNSRRAARFSGPLTHCLPAVPRPLTLVKVPLTRCRIRFAGMNISNRARLSGATLATLLVLTACGPGTQPSAAPTSAPAAAGNPTVAPTTAPAPPTAAAPTAVAKPTTVPGATQSTAAGTAAPSVSISGPFQGEARSLNAAGATFPAPLYQKWFDEYAKLTQVQVNYQAIGSGGGIKGIQDQTIDFGASDAPMTDDQLKDARGGEIFHIPTALGAIVPTYNLPNQKTKLKFTGETLAGIFLGDIQKWNDPKLIADNPDLADINEDIVVVHRSDGSGTTFGFTDYLSTVSPSWLQKVGRGTSVDWPVGLGGSGNPGVAGEVQQNPYSIGYVELIYAIQNNLGYGMVKNKAGKFIDPSLDSVTAAAASASQSIPPDLRFSIVDAPGDLSYPISTATWLLAYKNEPDQSKAVAISRLLWWATHDGQKFNKDLAYATVPDPITQKSEEFIRQISVEGNPVFPGQ
jgi:phosphate transport system substrate-binding protein